MTTPDPVRIRATGAVLWRPGPAGATRDEPEIALVHRPRYDDWSLPKGKLEPGESMPFAAVREVAEETGYVAHLGPALGEVHYDVPEGPKVVRYWAARSGGGAFVANDETDELRWLTPQRAAALLTRAHDVDVLTRFAAVGRSTAMVLLVRHAKAGSRSGWSGDDDLRPLSGTGREQARHLAALLPLFAPGRIATAPPVRCRETVAPTADALGLPVTEEPLLGEEGYGKDPVAALVRLRELAAEPGVTVLSSQGGVIPELVRELLADLPDVDPDTVRARKASTWALGFTEGTLRTADYYHDPTG